MQLDRYTAAADVGDSHDRHPRLALEHGLAVHQASLRWAEQTIAVLQRHGGGTGRSGAAPGLLMK
ncbi:MAG TPA: hypothetical protein VKU39_08970 [Streptosporangiaceae bacterium]|nr:hypothetical protein [Streptosporangiaceae bacterium]